MKKIGITIHGGAGTIRKSELLPEREIAYLAALSEALDAGYRVLQKDGSSLDAVEQAVRCLEDNPLFNAGKGSVFTHDGRHEMDASIMEGKNLHAGAAACITGIKNPVTLAKAVMEKSGHVMLTGKGAEEFAKSIGLEFENEDYFFDSYRYEQWQQVKDEAVTQLDHSEKTPGSRQARFGTVGAVALDRSGNIAAATSTGGMTNKRFGRVGDTPIIGSGTYADNRSCAVSCTGHGEYFIRSVTAYDVACLMKYKGMNLQDACRAIVHGSLKKLGGEGGLIAIDAEGNIALEFNTEGMYRGSVDVQGNKTTEIYK